MQESGDLTVPGEGSESAPRAVLAKRITGVLPCNRPLQMQGDLTGSLKKNRAHATDLSGNTTSTQNPPNASERPNAIRPP